MPVYELRCLNGHTDDQFVHSHADFGCQTKLCSACQSTMTPILSMGRGLTYFEEGRGRWIHNMGHDPVYVTSHEQHKRLMKERNLAPAYKWTQT
jgi:hypothetical protein